jgi:hypothetical protein
VQITNVYPQGQTLYTSPSVGSYGQAYRANPNLAIAAIQDQQKQISQNLQSAISLQLQTQNNNADIARLQLAEKIITQSLRSSLKLNSVQSQSDPNPVSSTVGQSYLITSCSKCHSGAQPKGGVFLGKGAVINSDLGMRITQILAGQQIPKGMESVIESLDRDTKNGLLLETVQSWEKE